jgi:hypothetical protein
MPYCAAPRQVHLQDARKVMGYLRKFPRQEGYVINPESPHFDPIYKNVGVNYIFGNQYNYFHKDVNPRFLPPLLDELDLNLFLACLLTLIIAMTKPLVGQSQVRS